MTRPWLAWKVHRLLKKACELFIIACSCATDEQVKSALVFRARVHVYGFTNDIRYSRHSESQLASNLCREETYQIFRAQLP